jgi:hypothetical protein
VLVPAGKYLIGTVHLRSHVTLMLDAGAELVGSADLEQYTSYTEAEGATSGKPSRWHRAMLVGGKLTDVTIAGRGVINGNNVTDPQGEEHLRGPHGILLRECSGVTIRDVSIRDAGNYAMMLEATSHVEVRGVKITGGWDGVHFRGRADAPCRDVTISNCELYTGDDCIAGWYWQDTLIDRCVLNSSCNGIRLIGPADRLIVHACLFFGPGRFEHRTSRDKHRTNMLAGLCLQPGAWAKAEGVVDHVHVSDVVMHDVTTPLHLSAKAGHTIGQVSIDRMTATGAYRAAASIESWGDEPIGRVDLRDCTLEFTGGGTEQQAATEVRSPGVDARPLPAWGIYARHVAALNLANVRLTLEAADARPAMIFEGVERLGLEGVTYPGEGSAAPVMREVKEVRGEAKAVK